MGLVHVAGWQSDKTTMDKMSTNDHSSACSLNEVTTNFTTDSVRFHPMVDVVYPDSVNDSSEMNFPGRNTLRRFSLDNSLDVDAVLIIAAEWQAVKAKRTDAKVMTMFTD